MLPPAPIQLNTEARNEVSLPYILVMKYFIGNAHEELSQLCPEAHYFGEERISPTAVALTAALYPRGPTRDISTLFAPVLKPDLRAFRALITSVILHPPFQQHQLRTKAPFKADRRHLANNERASSHPAAFQSPQQQAAQTRCSAPPPASARAAASSSTRRAVHAGSWACLPR